MTFSFTKPLVLSIFYALNAKKIMEACPAGLYLQSDYILFQIPLLLFAQFLLYFLD